MLTPTPSCAGQWELFDSLHHDDHLIAARICATCPLAGDWCETQRLHALTHARATGNDGSIEGTWNGSLYIRGILTLRPCNTPHCTNTVSGHSNKHFCPDCYKTRRAKAQAIRRANKKAAAA